MNVEFAVFARLADRCGEIAGETGAPPVLVTVYQASCAQPLAAYLSAMTAIEDATTRAKNATSGMERMLEDMEQQFRIARCAVTAILPETKLPDTLKSQPTDTDKRRAIERLVEIITPHAGQPWADALLQGEFGQSAGAAVQQLNAAIEAQNALQKAKSDRTAALKPAWDAFLRFKRLVRSTLGSTARQYRRIHLRGGAAKVEEMPEEEAPGEEAPEEAPEEEAPEEEAAEEEGEEEAGDESAPPVSEPVPSAA
jgi:hypothetical protein